MKRFNADGTFLKFHLDEFACWKSKSTVCFKNSEMSEKVFTRVISVSWHLGKYGKEEKHCYYQFLLSYIKECVKNPFKIQTIHTIVPTSIILQSPFQILLLFKSVWFISYIFYSITQIWSKVLNLQRLKPFCQLIFLLK